MLNLFRFNGHLRKKGISGHIKINYEEKTLSVEVSPLNGFHVMRKNLFLIYVIEYIMHFFNIEQVKMPQDASSSSVRDTRGLSGFFCLN